MRDHGETHVLEALSGAAKLSPVDPIPWIKKRLEKLCAPARTSTVIPGSDEHLADLAWRLKRGDLLAMHCSVYLPEMLKRGLITVEESEL